eukprot:scaffold5998_cov98-Pinguiococcus_pyrenoidosus.AAC.1
MYLSVISRGGDAVEYKNAHANQNLQRKGCHAKSYFGMASGLIDVGYCSRWHDSTSRTKHVGLESEKDELQYCSFSRFSKDPQGPGHP